jgi:replicative DNA helicase
VTSIDDAPVVPANDEAENWVIGSLLKDGNVIGELLDVVKAADFHSPRHGAAFAAAVQLARQQAPIDYGMLAEEMALGASMTVSDALFWLSSIGLEIPTAAHARHYAEIVRRKAIFRRLISAAQSITEDAYRAVGDPADVISAALQRIVDVRSGLQDQDLVTPTAWAEQTWTDLHTGTTRILAGLSTGIFELDIATLGLVPAELYVLAARTSVGKTTLMTQVAHHVATHTGPVLFVSCEMRPELLFDRTLAAMAGVSVNRLAQRSLRQIEWNHVEKELQQLSGTPLHVLRRHYHTSDIRDAILRLEARNERPVMVLVDFIQMLQDQVGDGRTTSSNFGEATKRLKLIAEDFNIPVVAASQLNRESEYQHRPPSLADLSLSDQIAHYADAVLALHREKDGDGSRRTVLLTLKRRNLGRPEMDDPCELVWTGTRYDDPHPVEHYQRLFEQYGASPGGNGSTQP